MCQSFYFDKVAGEAWNFVKEETLAQVFSCAFYKIFKNAFSTELTSVTASLKSKLKAPRKNHTIQTKKNDLLEVDQGKFTSS